MPLTVGDIAPDFTLYNTEKQALTLSLFRGKKVVLLFFPLAFSSTCTAELCGIRDDMDQYNNLDAVILAVSIDSVFSLKKFKEDQHFTFELLSDFNKEVSAMYGAQYETFILEMKGVAKRSVFVIDQKGMIQYAEVSEVAGNIPNFELVKSVLNTL